MQRFRKRKLQMAELLRIGLLMVRGDRVMDRRMHATVEEALLEGGAIGNADDEEVPDVGVLAGADGRRRTFGALISRR